MGRKSFDSSSTKSRKSNKSTISRHALATLALQAAGAAHTVEETVEAAAAKGRVRRSQSVRKRREMAFLAKRSQSVKQFSYARRHPSGCASYVNVTDAAAEMHPDHNKSGSASHIRTPSITVHDVDESEAAPRPSRTSLPSSVMKSPASTGGGRSKRAPFLRTQSVDVQSQQYHFKGRRSSSTLSTTIAEVKSRSRSPARVIIMIFWIIMMF